MGIAQAGTSDSESAQQLADALESLIAQLGLPTRLQDAGVQHQDLERVAQSFSARGAVPAQVGASTLAEIQVLLESAW